MAKPSPCHPNVIGMVCSLSIFMLIGCERSNPSQSDQKIPAAFIDVTQQAGFNHRHHKPLLDQKLSHINAWVSSVGAAAAAGDYNRDGWIDLYVTDSRKGYPNYLYRNNGDGTFTDVAKTAGVADLNGDKGTSMDCVFGDYDNDGWIDLYVLRWGEDALFRNRGDGTFEDVTAKLFRRRNGSPGMTWANGNAVLFFDDNLDGLLDIYVGNYFDELDLWHLPHTRIMHDDFEKSRNGGRNFLFRQQPGGGFVEMASALGVDDPGWTLAIGSADINNDGYPDLYCADDFGPDQLFINNRHGAFTNVTEQAIGFDTKKGMNVDFGDFNNDGWLDIYVTNITTTEYLQEGNMLWHNNGVDDKGNITFTDISLETNTYDGGWGWGAKFFDLDNDGDLDIITMNGFISAGKGNFWYDLASWTVTGSDSSDAANWPPIGDRSFSGYETVRLWDNQGQYNFIERAKSLGLDNNRDGRGVVVFDYDNDGDLDLYLANQDQPPNLYQNQSPSSHHWLTIHLVADATYGVNRDGIGSRVTAMTSSGLMIRERDGGNGYAAQSDPRIHFGLGKDTAVQLLEVRWPDGGLQYLQNVAADRIITIKQNRDHYADHLALKVGPPKPWIREEALTRKIPPIDAQKLDQLLTEMENILKTHPAGFVLASSYRAKCADYDQHDRSIRFFKQLVEMYPDRERTRIELGCALVDKIPTCGGLAAIVSKGSLAKQALDQMDKVVAEHDQLWVAYYCRGMNHLHWPRALLHSDSAVEDFQKSIELQKKTQWQPPPPYFLRSYVGLGDAYTKAGKYDRARKSWREGLALFPRNALLLERLAIKSDDDLLALVESKRNLQQPIDTSLAFLDRHPQP